MHGKKVMVTGGAGFVGSHLVDSLLANDNEVHVFDFMPLEKANNLMNAKTHKNFHYFNGDIKKPEDVVNFYQTDADIIFHLASVVGISNYIADPFNLVDVVVLGTRYFLERAIKHNTRFVFSSTSEIFGKNPDVPWREDGDRVLGPTSIHRWSYSSSKAACEHMIYGAAQSYNLPFSIVRFFNVYGPRQNPIFVVSKTIKNILLGEIPTLYDGGQMTRCFTYIDDIIRGLLLCGVSEKALGQAINLGNTVEVTMEYVVTSALKFADVDFGYQDINTNEQYGNKYEDIIRRVPCADKALNLLGWKAEIQVEDGIRRTLEWAKENEWWYK